MKEELYLRLETRERVETNEVKSKLQEEAAEGEEVS